MVGNLLLYCGVGAIVGVWFLVAWTRLGALRVTTLAANGILWVAAITTVVAVIGTPRESIITYSGEKEVYAEIAYQVGVVGVLALSLVSILPTGVRRAWRNAALTSFLVYALSAIGGAALATNSSVPVMFIGVLFAGIALCTAPGLTLEGFVQNLRLVLRIFTYGSLVAILINFQWAFSVEAQIQDRHFFGVPQLFGLTGHPNALGAVAAAACAVEAANIARTRLFKWHTAVAVAVVFLSQSRTGWIAAFLGLVLLAGPASRFLRWFGVAALGVIGAVMFVLPGALQMIESVLTGADVTTLNGRTVVWNLALTEFYANPAFGYGPELFSASYRENILGPRFAFVGQAHNQFVHTIAQGGIFLLAALIVFLIGLLVAAVRGQVKSAGLSFALFIVLLERMLTETPLLHRGADPSFILDLATVAIIALATRGGSSFTGDDRASRAQSSFVFRPSPPGPITVVPATRPERRGHSNIASLDRVRRWN